MKSSISILLFILFANTIFSQSAFLGSDFHKQQREELRQKLAPQAFAVFFSAEEKNRSNDVNYPFHQNPDFFYLTGYKEPNSVLIILKDSIKINDIYTNEIIFVRPKDERAELWNGKRLGIDGVINELGFTTVFGIEDLLKSEISFTSLSEVLVLKDSKNKFLSSFPELKKKINFSLLDIYMNELRETKTQVELLALRKAIDISCIGQIETMKALNPKMSEMEAQGIHEFVFKKFGCQEVGYPSIVGAGNNSCVLHYIKNDKDLTDGELILMDVGAEFEGYSADITRTIPVNGKFSDEQKIIYSIVKKAQEAGFEECKVGNNFFAPGKVAQEIIAEELLKLGIISKLEEVRKYFPHGTSHYLGLDVHDRGTFGTFKPNTVITVEPGIYIPDGSPCDKKWWGIGVRIEDDILITENGWENLSKNAPKNIEEIEQLMKETSPFNDFNPLLK